MLRKAMSKLKHVQLRANFINSAVLIKNQKTLNELIPLLKLITRICIPESALSSTNTSIEVLKNHKSPFNR